MDTADGGAMTSERQQRDLLADDVSKGAFPASLLGAEAKWQQD